MPEIFNRKVLREGMLVSRRTNTPIGSAILIATGIPEHWWYRFTPSHIIGLTHDAEFVRDPADGRLKIGDALMGADCQLTEIEEWERGCWEEGTKVIVGWPNGATAEQGILAARWWLENVNGHDYDKVAIWRLALKALAGDWISGHVGLLSDFYCTESVVDSWAKGGMCNPWYPNENATPGTTSRRYIGGQILEVAGALTAIGLQHRVYLPRYGTAAIDLT